jgi:Universal stress protein UspA and related nucleotide-binding proteins
MVVIAAVDRSGRASIVLEEAERLAEAFGTDAQAAHVLSKEEFVALQRTQVDETGSAIPTGAIQRAATEVAEEIVEDAGYEMAAVGLVGTPADELISHATEQDADYVVLAGRERSAVGKALFGSTAQAVILHGHLPVVFVPVDSA